MASETETPLTTTTSTASPGNAYFPESPPMRLPSLSFLYRLECLIDKDIIIGAPFGHGVVRVACPILSGTVRGPGIQGEVLPGGADWAQEIEGTNASILDARYIVRTNDGQHLYICARGIYRPGPGTACSVKAKAGEPLSTVTQDDVEFFSHLQIEAGLGKYNWLNGLVIVGVMTHVEDRIIIDAYSLTNFPGVPHEGLVAKFSSHARKE